ncbi:MAG: HRDC domain-containing protein [Myxococcota bacterium]
MVYIHTEGTFNDEAIQAFQDEHDVIDAQLQFFHHYGCPVWMVLVRYRGVANASERRERWDWRASLNDEEKKRFDRLKAWRAERAKKDGLSAYLILTNRQLASVIRRCPRNLAELRELGGIGEKTAERYGRAILAMLNAPEQGASA